VTAAAEPDAWPGQETVRGTLTVRWRSL